MGRQLNGPEAPEIYHKGVLAPLFTSPELSLTNSNSGA
jgi:hypothetical protein